LKHSKNGTFNFSKEGELTVEVSECEEDPDKERLLSTAPADFDINLLGYDGRKEKILKRRYTIKESN
jgi:hypothetical protein